MKTQEGFTMDRRTQQTDWNLSEFVTNSDYYSRKCTSLHVINDKSKFKSRNAF